MVAAGVVDGPIGECKGRNMSPVWVVLVVPGLVQGHIAVEEVPQSS